jgi:flagellum-specific peptidoglycan hydrolase FlgJ
MKPSEFIDELLPSAMASQLQTGIPASFVIAEGALESAWGKSRLATEGMNLFGVKANHAWRGKTITMNTREHINGEWKIVPAVWRKYENWLGCLKDHAEFFLVNPRYKPALDVAHDAIAFTKAVAAAGYATDPEYANKTITIINAHNLQELD